MRFRPIDKLIEILKSIRCGNTQATDLGLCYHIQLYWNEWGYEDIFPLHECNDYYLPYVDYRLSNLIEYLMIEWPDSTGSGRYPVPASKGCKCVISAEKVFKTTDDLWQGSQLTLRYSLIDYMINKLNKIAGDMDDFIY